MDERKKRGGMAAQWFVDVTDNPMDELTESRFATWLDSDPANADEFLRCEAAMQIARRLASHKDTQWAFMDTANPSVNSGANRDTHRGRLLAETWKRRWFQNPAYAWTVAAVFAALAAFPFAGRRAPGPSTDDLAVPAPRAAGLELTFAASEPVVLLPGQVIVDAHSVAVLPFVGDADGGADRRLADRLHGEVVKGLAAIPGVYVIDRESVAAYEESKILPRDIAAQLGVRGVVEGSVASADGRVRVVLRFTDAASERLLQDAHERSVNELERIEADIVTNIAVALAGSSRTQHAASNVQGEMQ